MLQNGQTHFKVCPTILEYYALKDWVKNYFLLSTTEQVLIILLQGSRDSFVSLNFSIYKVCWFHREVANPMIMFQIICVFMFLLFNLQWEFTKKKPSNKLSFSHIQAGC